MVHVICCDTARHRYRHTGRTLKIGGGRYDLIFYLWRAISGEAVIEIDTVQYVVASTCLLGLRGVLRLAGATPTPRTMAWVRTVTARLFGCVALRDRRGHSLGLDLDAIDPPSSWKS